MKDTLELLSGTRPPVLFRMIPFAAVAVITLISWGLWQWLHEEETKRIQSRAAERAANVNTIIRAALGTRMEALQRMAERWDSGNSDSSRTWRDDSKRYLRDFPSMQAIARADRFHHIELVEPEAYAEQIARFTDLETDQLGIALLKACEDGEATASKHISPGGSGSAMLVAIPIPSTDCASGFIVGVFSITTMFDTLSTLFFEDFEVSILEQGEYIYSNASGANAEDANGAMVYDYPIHVLSNEWSVKLRPTAAFVDEQRSFIPHVVLGAGILLALCFGGVVFYGLRSYHSAIRLSRTNIELTREVSERERAEREVSALNDELETRVAERTKALATANRELDEFAYVASHDLQEPLRKQKMFAEVLREAMGTNLPEDAGIAVRAITSSADRMISLVRDLLALSRSRSRPLSLDRVDLRTCADNAIEDLELRIRESGATIRRGELPMITGDATLVTELFQNLIANALKFRVKDRPPTIEIDTVRMNGNVVIGVRDNGIGISDDARKQIFEPFRRLNPRNEFDGSGIGLSICRKVVERHGGTIWVEASEHEGSHFLFTLPGCQEIRTHA